jgi:hypothetical protein
MLMRRSIKTVFEVKWRREIIFSDIPSFFIAFATRSKHSPLRGIHTGHSKVHLPKTHAIPCCDYANLLGPVL